MPPRATRLFAAGSDHQPTSGTASDALHGTPAKAACLRRRRELRVSAYPISYFPAELCPPPIPARLQKIGFFVIPAQAGIQNSLFFWFQKPGLRLSPE